MTDSPDPTRPDSASAPASPGPGPDGWTPRQSAADRRADIPLGASTRPAGDGVSAVEIIALGLSLVWLVISGFFFLRLPSEAMGESEGARTLRFVMALMGIFLPVAMIWVAALAARASRVVREESRRLQAAVDAMRQTYVSERQARGSGIDHTVERRLNEIARAAQKAETALATFHTSRAAVQSTPGRAARPRGTNKARQRQPPAPMNSPVWRWAPMPMT